MSSSETGRHGAAPVAIDASAAEAPALHSQFMTSEFGCKEQYDLKPPLGTFNPRETAPAATTSLPSSPPRSSMTDPPRRRSLCVRPRRLELLKSRSPPPSRSQSPSPPEFNSPTLQNSYQFVPPETPGSRAPEAHYAALRIQRAWHRYRTLSARSFCEFGDDAVRLVQRFMSGADFDDQEAQTPSSRPHLILHFDVNKTILISDAAKGANQSDMINMLISECAWGRMTVGPTWVPVGRLATDRSDADPQLMTYRNFLDSFLYPYIDGVSEKVLQENIRRKKLCGNLQKTFTDPGQPGEMFSGVFRALAERLAQPPTERGDAAAARFFKDGQRFILPSFFELLMHLQATNRSFTVVFRTFGSDIQDVIEEINMFAGGRHPSYPGVFMDGRDGMTDIRLAAPTATGAFIRSGTGPEDTVLALGVDATILSSSRMSRQLVEDSVCAHDGVLLQGFQEILEAFKLLACPLGRTPLHSWPIREHSSHLNRPQNRPQNRQNSSSPKSLKSFPAVSARSSSPRSTTPPHNPPTCPGPPLTTTSSSSLRTTTTTAPSDTAPTSASPPSEDSGDLGGASGLSTGLHAAKAWVGRHRQTRSCAIAIRDFYHFWKSRSEHSRAGKPLIVDPRDSSVVQMFFDDNIGFSKPHIVDARDSRTGESIPFSQSRQAFLTRSEPVNAILDPKYFVRAVSEAELSILHLREQTLQQAKRSKRIHIGGHHRLVSQFTPTVPCVKELRVRSDTLSKLSARGQSTVARTSLAARHRWEWALRRVLTLIRISKVFQESSL